jgi:hypothetical protein
MRTASKFTAIHACLAALIVALTAAPAPAAVDLPGGKKVDKVDFERHLMGLFGRSGCSMGSCHGSFQGKGGFRLSLFSFNPEPDFFAITRDGLARRISMTDPDSSILLLKATGQVEHAGGVRFQRDSWQYKIIRDWIAAGAPWSQGSGDVKKITVTPSDHTFTKPGDASQIQVRATFADGTEEDITNFCEFRTNDDFVAEVTNLGHMQAMRPGSTAIVVSYRGNVLPVRVIVPLEQPASFKYPQVPEVNFVDREVFSRLRRLNMVPSDLSSDEEFLRRVTIDTIGCLPTPAEIRAFKADTSANKRAKKIDELLAHPMHAALWATKFCDITGNDTTALENPQQLKPKRSQMWHDWFRKRVAENMPYDKIVKGVLTATSRDGKSPEEWIKDVIKADEDVVKGYESDYAKRETLDLFWRRQQNVTIDQWGEKTAAAFMGVRLECAQCHKHPFDRWSQEEYRAHANIFAQLNFQASPEAKKVIDTENAFRKTKAGKNNQLAIVKEVWVMNTGKLLPHPETGAFLPPKAPGGPVLKMDKGKDLRVDLYNWLVQPDNPFFARSFTNRIWGHYFGKGIVDPVDDFSLGNPPSNDKLLDALAKEFVDKKFDIRHIERLVLNSRTYQLSSRANDTNKLDKVNYARSYIRPMMAEAVVDVLNTALGVTEKWNPDVKPGSRAVEVGASQVQNPSMAYAFRIFGRPPRTAACDCERAMEPALPQKLYMMTDLNVLGKIDAADGNLQRILKTKMGDDKTLEELFLATLSRMPSASDRQAFADHLKVEPDRQKAFRDLMWALINTREFILNH